MTKTIPNLLLAGIPMVAADIAYTPNAPSVPFEWNMAVQVLAGTAVLLAMVASAINIWKMTRPVPPIGDQIRAAIEAHDVKSQQHYEERCEQVNRMLMQMERRQDAHENCIRTIERTVAALEERTRRHQR